MSIEEGDNMGVSGLRKLTSGQLIYSAIHSITFGSFFEKEDISHFLSFIHKLFFFPSRRQNLKIY